MQLEWHKAEPQQYIIQWTAPLLSTTLWRKNTPCGPADRRSSQNGPVQDMVVPGTAQRVWDAKG